MTKQQVLNQLRGWGEKVEPKMFELLEKGVEERFQHLARYQIETGGKRLRLGLVIGVCQMLGGALEQALYPAAGIEILHNYTLIIDDIIDKSDIRRGKPTCWRKFGQSVAECMGIYYGASVFQAAQRVENKHISAQISGLFSVTIKQIINGEILDVLFEQSGRAQEPFVLESRFKSIDQEDYLRMVRKKTASLFEACCLVGGLVAGATSQQLKDLKEYGLNLGIAFQVRDDILDVFGEKKKFGKEIGHDFKESKLGNIVILYALREQTKQGQKAIQALLKKENLDSADIKQGLKLIRQTQARARAQQFGAQYAKKAKQALNTLPQNKWNQFLEDVADLTIQREK